MSDTLYIVLLFIIVTVIAPWLLVAVLRGVAHTLVAFGTFVLGATDPLKDERRAILRRQAQLREEKDREDR